MTGATYLRYRMHWDKFSFIRQIECATVNKLLRSRRGSMTDSCEYGNKIQIS